MKKALVALFFLLASQADAQVNWSVVMGKQRFSQGFALPIKDTLSYMALMDSGAVVLKPSDSALYYRYKSKWQKVGAGGGPTIDTTSLSNRINARIDSLRRSNDSVFARKNGAFVFQYKDSVGTNPPPNGYYGAFIDTLTQTAAVINTAYPVNLSITNLSNGITINNNLSGNPTRITMVNAGIYNIQFSLQLEKTGGSGNMTADVWLRKNGVNLPNTTGKLVLTGSVNASPTIAAWNYVVNASSNDYYELIWSASNVNLQIVKNSATTLHPLVPSAILTVTQQSGIMAGTGISPLDTANMLNPYLRKLDTTSLSTRINGRIDSLRRSRDSVFARKNGVFVFQYKDSIGGGSGTTPTLSQVVNVGNTVNDNTILLTYNALNYRTLWANKSGTSPFISFSNNNDTSYLRADNLNFFNKGLFDTSGAHLLDLGLDSTLSRLALRWGNKNGSEVVKYKSLLPAYNQDIDQGDNHTYFLPDMNDTTAKYLVTSVNNKRANIMGDVTMGSDCATASLVAKFSSTNAEPPVLTWEYFCNQTGVTYSMFYYTDNKFRLVDNAVNTSQAATFTNVWLGGVQFKNEAVGTEYYANIYKIDDHTIEISLFRNTGDPVTTVQDACFEVRFYGSAPTSGDTTNPY